VSALVPSDDAFNLLVMDYGHLTAAGSAYVVDRVLPELSVPSRESPVPPLAPR
jgi:hypothetical protein